jgi:outer membrane protein TolC
MKNINIIGALIFGTFSMSAQELKLEEAINLALTSNHNISISNQKNRANQKGIHRGAVGYLPTVDATGSASYSNNVSNQEFATSAFPDVKDQEAASSITSAKIAASYLIFNGFGRARSYSKLKESGKLSDLQTKISLESTLLQVVNSYFDVVRKSEQLNFMKQSILISKDRLKRVETNYEYGNGGKIDVLNAKVDYNNDSSSLINASLALKQSKHQLNFLLGRVIETEFVISTLIDVPVMQTLEVYKEKAKSNNTSIVLSEVQLNMATIDRKINQSNFMPVVSAQVNYGYAGSGNEVGIIQKSSSVGYTAAVSLSWNLFDGFKRKKALEQAKILIDVNGSKRAQAVLNVDMELQNYYHALKTNLSLIALEEGNLKLAKLNLQKSKELFYNGSINNVQFRQAQLNLVQAQNKINNYKYMSKIYEYQLMRLTNELVK